MNKSNRLLLFVIWLFVTISFLTTQLTNDFMVFGAYGRFVSNSEETGIGALIDTWEMKGLLFKTYLYVEYALTSLFSTSFDEYCQTVYKIIGIIPFFTILLVSILIFPQLYLNKYKKIDVFFITSILLLSVHFASHFQAEMWGVLLMLLSFSIYVHEGWKSKVVAAIIYSLTFYLKSPIPLLGGSLVAASFILKKQSLKECVRDIIPFTITSAIFLSLSLVLIGTFYPQEINDIWNASYYQHTLFHESSKIVSSCVGLVNGLIKSPCYNPVCAVGFIIVLILFSKWFKIRLWINIVSLLLIWTFPLSYVLLSNCFFVYHYYLLVYSALLSLIIFLHSDIVIKRKVIIGLSIAYITYYIIVLSSICPTNLYEKDLYARHQKEMELKENVYVGCKLGDGDIMYLDDGMGAFFFSNKSYLRYFYPLPLQRVICTDKFVRMSTYVSTKDQALSYKGEYITLNKKWFLKNGNNYDVYKKITKEYNLYKQLVYSNYSWKLFVNTPAIDTLLIYKKR